MHGRTDVVNEAGQRELGRPRSAADGLFRLEHHDLVSGRREDDGRAQTVGPRTDYNRINHSYDENNSTDAGVLVLTLVVRASPCGYLPGRLHRRRKAVRALAG